jgi:hypothetical protein
MTEKTHVQTADERPDDPETSPLIDARLALLSASYPALITDESRELIRSEIGNAIARDARLRRHHLGSGDDPMALFRPYRAAESEGNA